MRPSPSSENAGALVEHNKLKAKNMNINAF